MEKKFRYEYELDHSEDTLTNIFKKKFLNVSTFPTECCNENYGIVMVKWPSSVAENDLEGRTNLKA